MCYWWLIGQHQDISLDCIEVCVTRLTAMEKSGVIVIDDEFLILGEYQNKTNLNPPKGVGDVFLKMLLRNIGNAARVEQVKLTKLSENMYSEFPDQDLQPTFDAPDRKFAAVANAHPDKPPIWQAADCKWLDWWPALQATGINIEFLCPDDACEFYTKKFPQKPKPVFPS